MPAFLRRPVVWIVAAILVVGAGAGVFALQSGQARTEKAEAAKAPPPASPYVAVANGKADVEGGVIQVAARTAGVVREVLVQEGDQVAEGQVLARLEDDEQRLAAARAAAEVRQARAQLSLTRVQIAAAQREHARLERLAASNFVAAQRLDTAMDEVRRHQATLAAQEATVATAAARQGEADYNLELTVIRAPADGVIVRRYANPGSGASTLNVSNMFDLEPRAPRIVRAEISEAALPHVQIGQRVQISPESDPSRTYEGAVLRRAAVFGARKLQSDDPTERTDERVVEVVVSADETPFLVGQRVLVKFLRAGAAVGAAANAAAAVAAAAN